MENGGGDRVWRMKGAGRSGFGGGKRTEILVLRYSRLISGGRRGHSQTETDLESIPLTSWGLALIMSA